MGTDKIELELRKFVAPEFVFGTGARKLAANYCNKLGCNKVMVVSDPGIGDTPWLSEIESILRENSIDYVIYNKVSPNPRDYEIMEGTEYYHREKCDIMLAIGGGSVLDAAKGIGIVSSNHGKIHDYEGVDKIIHPIPPLICIPTTSGTSADLSQFAIVNNTREKYKMALISKALVPDVSLIDPAVLTSMSPYLLACTGMDALSHAFEAYVSTASSAFTDMNALEAIRLVRDNLQAFQSNIEDEQAAGKIMLASLYAGLAFSNTSLGCVHSMAHSLGGYLDLPHGECNAILLPHVVDYNFDHANEKYSHLAKILGISTRGMNSSQIKKGLVNYLLEFRNSLLIKDTLRQKGVNADITSVLAKKAIMDPCNATNPRIPKEKDLKAIYMEAI